MTPTDIAVLSMIIDLGWKVYTERTKNMSLAEIDAFILNKETSVEDIKADLEEMYGN